MNKGAGALRESIRFEKRAATAGDGYGNFEDAWTAIATVAASIKPARGSEAVIASRLEGREPVEITVRWQTALADVVAGLTADHRAVDARTGKIYAIQSVANFDLHNRYITVTAEAGIAP